MISPQPCYLPQYKSIVLNVCIIYCLWQKILLYYKIACYLNAITSKIQKKKNLIIFQNIILLDFYITLSLSIWLFCYQNMPYLMLTNNSVFRALKAAWVLSCLLCVLWLYTDILKWVFQFIGHSRWNTVYYINYLTIYTVYYKLFDNVNKWTN